MDIHRFSGFATKKQRSSSRKPRSSIASLSDRDLPFYSSPPCSDNNGKKLSPRKNPEHSSSLARKDIKNVEGNGNACSNGSTENKLKTLKLKVRIRTNANSDNRNSNSNTKPLVASEASKPKSRLSHQDNVDDEKPSKARGNVLQGVSSKDNHDTKDTLSKVDDHVRKGNRAPRKRALDEEEEEDDEIRYLQKMKSSKVATDSKSSKSVKTKHDVDEHFGSLSRKKMKRSDREANDGNHVEEENTSGLTKRQRALHNGGSSIEFPDGLPPAPSRKQKLTEEEKLAKKVEAAQRRKMQVEKANRESEAEAIRKILGQDSNRKKKEEKLRKQRDDLAQKKAEEAMVVASNSIRYVMRPTGNIVTFGEAIGLPSIFSQNTISYPPPREKCAGPSCTNAYKYRDSKSNLPLCSLQCYRAVQESSKTISC